MNGVAGDPLGPGSGASRRDAGRKGGPRGGSAAWAEVDEDRWQRPPRALGRIGRWVAGVVVVALLVSGAAGLWLVRQLNPGGTADAPVNFTVVEGDTVSSVADRL